MRAPGSRSAGPRYVRLRPFAMSALSDSFPIQV